MRIESYNTKIIPETNATDKAQKQIILSPFWLCLIRLKNASEGNKNCGTELSGCVLFGLNYAEQTKKPHTIAMTRVKHERIIKFSDFFSLSKKAENTMPTTEEMTAGIQPKRQIEPKIYSETLLSIQQ
ncbi:MAG: hypothetical protein IKO57_07265 [Treponema sp.]|nr:hypothetical protein [Treponema sp.]